MEKKKRCNRKSSGISRQWQEQFLKDTMPSDIAQAKSLIDMQISDYKSLSDGDKLSMFNYVKALAIATDADGTNSITFVTDGPVILSVRDRLEKSAPHVKIKSRSECEYIARPQANPKEPNHT